MRALVALAVTLTILSLTAPARAGAACGGAEAPCESAGGTYHFAPAGAKGGPAVIFLHGWGGTGRDVIRNRGLVKAFEERGYALIAPQALPRWEGDKGGGWNSYGRDGGRDDVAFLQDVAVDAAARHGIDRGRIILAGFSGGGMMTWRAACEAPDGFAAYAPIAGLLWRPLPERCASPVRLLHIHGWSDEVVPIEGRSVANGALTQGDLFVGLALMRRTLGCARDDPDAFAARGRFLIRSWTDCASGGGLALALHPAGHATPAGWVGLTLDWFEGAPLGG